MITEYKKVVKLLTKREKRRLYFLTIIKIFSGIMDTLGVASIAPFLAVLSKPEILDNNVIILRLKEIFDLNNQSIIFCFAFGSLFIIIINQFVRLLNSWYEKYAIKNIWWSFHCKLFKFYLTRPYSFHIQTNSKNLLEKLQVETSLAVDGTIASIYQILGNIATCVFLFSFLLVIYPIVSIVIFFAAGASYWLIFSRLKKKINEYAEFQPLFAEKTFVLIDRAFQSIKDIIIKNKEVSDIAISLMSKRLVFDFATQFRYKNEEISSIEKFEITDEIFNNFVEFLSDKEYQYTTATEDALDIFKEITDEEGTSELISEEFNLLIEKIKLNKENDLGNNKEEINEFLSNEIVSRYYYQEGRIVDRLKHDKDIDEALRLFKNMGEYYSLLKTNE